MGLNTSRGIRVTLLAPIGMIRGFDPLRKSHADDAPIPRDGQISRFWSVATRFMSQIAAALIKLPLTAMNGVIPTKVFSSYTARLAILSMGFWLVIINPPFPGRLMVNAS